MTKVYLLHVLAVWRLAIPRMVQGFDHVIKDPDSFSVSALPSSAAQRHCHTVPASGCCGARHHLLTQAFWERREEAGPERAFSSSSFSFQGVNSFPETPSRLSSPSHWPKLSHMTTSDQFLAFENSIGMISCNNHDSSLVLTLQVTCFQTLFSNSYILIFPNSNGFTVLVSACVSGQRARTSHNPRARPLCRPDVVFTLHVRTFTEGSAQRPRAYAVGQWQRQGPVWVSWAPESVLPPSQHPFSPKCCFILAFSMRRLWVSRSSLC